MTAPRTTTRMRRAGSITSTIPPGVAEWFAGQATVDAAGWAARLPGDEAQLLAWWREWAEDHPGAVAPADAPWIAWPVAATMPAHGQRTCERGRC